MLSFDNIVISNFDKIFSDIEKGLDYRVLAESCLVYYYNENGSLDYVDLIDFKGNVLGTGSATALHLIEDDFVLHIEEICEEFNLGDDEIKVGDVCSGAGYSATIKGFNLLSGKATVKCYDEYTETYLRDYTFDFIIKGDK